ncbi:MAG: hypothetical protein LUE64_03180, partial [Candidatus Gastranaerophilales bacterium]|nr:hypothetical protein [Candidatus Gastranaerophilales bacterium]
MYEKTTWYDQDVENPRTYDIKRNSDGTYTLTDAFGEVTELGTPVNAENMNNIEEGVYNALNHSQITNCILSTPDMGIDLSITDGVLTLAAGAKAI